MLRVGLVQFKTLLLMVIPKRVQHCLFCNKNLTFREACISLLSEKDIDGLSFFCHLYSGQNCRCEHMLRSYMLVVLLAMPVYTTRIVFCQWHHKIS
jgi:hypothetical protein